MADTFGFGTPFEAQLAFMRAKLNLPTERWDDIRRSAHDRAFIVAGAAKADLLHDLRQAVDRTMAAGGGVAEFRQQFRAVVATNGWTGWTGEGSAKGEAWRALTIYRTNMATSYAAGRYRQLTAPAFLALRPFWRYHHADGVRHPRPLHLSWNGLTLRHDHEFWRTHFAPNGWGCHCWISAEAGPAPGAATEPPAGWDEIDPKTGVQVGLDRGFDYAPGAQATTPLADLVAQKLFKLDAPNGAQMWAALAPAIAMERQQAWWATMDTWLADPLPRGRLAVVGALSPKVLSWIDQRPGLQVPASAAIAVEDRLLLGAKARRHQADQNALLVSDWRALSSLLDQPGAVYLDTRSGYLVFVADGVGPTKVVIQFSKPGGAQAFNLVRTAFKVSADAVAASVKGREWIAVEVPGT